MGKHAKKMRKNGKNAGKNGKNAEKMRKNAEKCAFLQKFKKCGKNAEKCGKMRSTFFPPPEFWAHKTNYNSTLGSRTKVMEMGSPQKQGENKARFRRHAKG